MDKFWINWSKIGVFGLSLSWFASILMASIGIRLEAILPIPFWKQIQVTIFILNTGLGFILLFKQRWIWAVYSLLFYLGMLGHAFVIFNQPSFASGISFKNSYVLADFDSSPWVISSNLSFNFANLYLNNFFKFLFPALAIISLSQKHQIIIFKWIRFAFIVGFLANSALATYQGIVELTFWAEGSGTAVAAGRAPAFLEASGSSSVYFATMVVAIFWNLVFAKSTYSAFWSGVLLVIGFTGGVFAGGRVFFSSCLVSMSIGLILSIFQSLKTRDRRRFFFLTAISGVGVIIFLHLFLIHPFPDSKVITDSVKTILYKKLSVWKALETIDELRFGHVIVMWRAFTDHFWTGTGLGSTLANVYTYGYHLKIPKLLNDFPSCFYLQLMSELGIVGLILVILIIRIWLKQIFILGGNNIEIETSDLDYSKLLYWLIPTACGATTSLLVSFLIGVHFVYSIISIIATLALAIALLMMHNQPKILIESSIFVRFWRYIIPAMIAYLFLIGSVQALTPPRIPAFRWLEREIPQIPYHLKGEMEGRSGYWLTGGSEILLKSQLTNLYILHPDNSFPVKVKLELINTSAKKIQVKHFTLSHRQGITFELPNTMTKECLISVTPNHFCSLRVKTSAPWNLGPFEAGVFVTDSEAKFSRFEN